MQLEYRSKSELQNIFAFPIIYTYHGNVQKMISFNVEDKVNHTNHAITISLEHIPNEPYDLFMTFAKLSTMVSIQDKNHLDDFLNSIYMDADIYQSTIHLLTMNHYFRNVSTPINIQRYFVLPTMNVAQKNNAINPLYLKINRSSYDATISFSNNDNILEKTLSTVIRTTFSDIDLYSKSYIEERYINHTLNVANYEMQQVFSYVMTKNLQGIPALHTYDSVEKSTIIIPTTQGIPGNVEVTPTEKIIDFDVVINCQVFNGLELKDYSGFFIEHGAILESSGNDADVTFLVDKQSQ